MKRRLIWTKRALSRIDAIGRYISENNPSAAGAVVQRLRIVTLSLCDFPLQGRSGRINGTGELALADMPYVYQLTVDRIEILTIMHTSQQRPKRLR